MGNDQLLSIINADFVIVDEIGLLEFDDKGFMPGLGHLFRSYNGTFILSLRTSLQNRFDEFLKDRLPDSVSWEKILLNFSTNFINKSFMDTIGQPL